MYKKLKDLRISLGMTQEDFGKSIGLAKTTYNNYETGKREPKSDFWVSVAKKYGVSVDYLMGFTDNVKEPLNNITDQQLTPQGEKIGKAYEKAPQREQGIVEQVLEPYIDEDEEDCINLPLYDEPAAAGVGSYLDVGHYEEQSFPSSVVPRLTDYCVRIAGDSMEPDIPHGSIVFVQASPVVENGEAGIFLLGNHSYCKRLLIEQEEKKILLTSDNPKYDDIEIDATDSFNTLGKVLGVYDED